MNLKRSSDAGLIIRTQAWVPLAVFLAASLFLVGYALVQLMLGAGFSWEQAFAPLGVGMFFFAGATRFGRWWTIRFDQSAQRVEYRIGSLIGSRSGDIEFARIVGVIVRTLRVGSRGNRHRPRHALFFLLTDGSTFRITDRTAVIPVQIEELELIASTIRRELGLSEPGQDEVLLDAVLSAPSRVQAVQEVRTRLGGSLKSARDVVEAIRGADDNRQE